MVFGIGKKGGAPDIGKEENDESSEENVEVNTEEDVPIKKVKISSKSTGKAGEFSSLEVERIGAKVEALNGLIKEMNGRFSLINQNIGEIRSMNITNEKSISKVTKDSLRAIDIVNSVEPEKLRADFQRLDVRISQLSEKLESNKQFADTVMSELKDLRRKVNSFMNTEELLKFNGDIQKDLVATQQLVSKSKLYSDKTEQLFIEIRKGFAESEKANEKIKNLDSVYDSLQKEISRIRIDFSNIIKKSELDSLKKEMLSKLSVTENVAKQVDTIKDEHDSLERVVETILGIEEQNKEDIKNLTDNQNGEQIKKYDLKINSIVHLLDVLAGQVSEIKKKLDMGKTSKIDLSPEIKKNIKNGKSNLENIKFPQ